MQVGQCQALVIGLAAGHADPFQFEILVEGRPDAFDVADGRRIAQQLVALGIAFPIFPDFFDGVVFASRVVSSPLRDSCSNRAER